ncbi:DUF488 domain-containing protein [Vineibacter terrae]|uniref:DUF488 domain-containing protein n=1 Tax=Vineibacter terrae TaxID=2586908 RepID=A0A5C8PC05_9HYPH|nr:DUF488 domain-containing protein [Vineibacter terrae]TXL70906.1 DUF488 domain-containing protein [Vineibacter terrae]
MTKRQPDLRIKRAYDPPDTEDGARVLVDRLWPRGLSKEHAALTLWLKEIAPSTALRQWFGHDPARWMEFRRRYSAELMDNQDAVARLGDLLKAGRVTLVYGAHDAQHNQAVALAEHMREQVHPGRRAT